MLTSIKTRTKKTAEFVQNHQTLTACVVTAVVSWKMSHDVTLAGVLETTREQSYQWGYEAGEREVQLLTLLEFIDYKNLREEFGEFLKQQNS